ncbi:hypothetical protein [uncultured Nostoc sp.]|uniref:hypothetical protein n=1 Tax=uncultured Nostoc sp. TaxID=340711 RepID=UPI00261498EF|nr:hypothetical protein [uncultured Nostoc sp.]
MGNGEWGIADWRMRIGECGQGGQGGQTGKEADKPRIFTMPNAQCPVPNAPRKDKILWLNQ